MAMSSLCLRCEFLNFANALAIIRLVPMLCELEILWEPVALWAWQICQQCLGHQDGQRRVSCSVPILQRLENFGVFVLRSYNYLQVYGQYSK